MNYDELYELLREIPGTHCPRCAEDKGRLTEHGICQSCVDDIQTVETWETFKTWKKQIGRKRSLEFLLGPWLKVYKNLP
jgi:hypothetical protein